MAEQFPDELIQLVAQATEQHHIDHGVTDGSGNSPCVCGQWWDSSDMEGWDEHMAKVALAALDEAGRLLPPGVEITEKFGVMGDETIANRYTRPYIVGKQSREAAEEYVADQHDSWPEHRLRLVSRWASEWRAVGTEEQPDE